jgi:hypothetical protein
VPLAPIQGLRDLTRAIDNSRMRRSRTRSCAQKTLEDANLRLTHVMSNIGGVSSRAILNTLIAGEPEHHADLTHGRLKATRADVVDALHGRVSDHHRFMITLH